jgi:hypothetical protein
MLIRKVAALSAVFVGLAAAAAVPVASADPVPGGPCGTGPMVSPDGIMRYATRRRLAEQQRRQGRAGARVSRTSRCREYRRSWRGGLRSAVCAGCGWSCLDALDAAAQLIAFAAIRRKERSMEITYCTGALDGRRSTLDAGLRMSEVPEGKARRPCDARDRSRISVVLHPPDAGPEGTRRCHHLELVCREQDSSGLANVLGAMREEEAYDVLEHSGANLFRSRE